MSRIVEFEAPDLFTCGAVGPPGQRVFYLQAREAGDVVTLRLEKQQVAALATYLEGLLGDLGGAAAPDPATPLDLVVPIEEDWVVGSLAIGIGPGGDRIIVAADELIVDESDPLAAVPGTARLHLTQGQAAAFVPHATALVESGRPTCELCGRPINPDGHVCARKNGHGAH